MTLKKYWLTRVDSFNKQTIITENLFTYDLGEKVFDISMDNSVVDHAYKLNNRVFMSTNNLYVYVVVGFEQD